MHYICSRKHGSSSVGRAPVSKTGCREFEPLLPCNKIVGRLVSIIVETSLFFFYANMKILYIVLGTITLVLGIIGIFLPLLPTTPFLLLSAALYFRSSSRLYEWLLSHKYLGPYIRNFREHKAIPLRAKVVSVSLVWATLLYCSLLVVSQWWLKILLILLAIAISCHILSYKTLNK